MAHFIVDGYQASEEGPFVLHVDEAGCTDADLEALDLLTPSADEVFAACVTSCGPDPDPGACLLTCVQDGAEVEAKCAGCVVDALECQVSECAETCGDDWSSDDCADCNNAATATCEDVFYPCAGASPGGGGGDGPDSGVEADAFDLVPCPEGLPVIQDTELNNTDETAQAIGDPMSPGFCIQGGIQCGNDYLFDADIFALTLPADISATVKLEWLVSSDMDSYVFDTVGQQLLVNYVDGFDTHETDQGLNLLGNNLYLLQVQCWDGEDQGYAFSVQW